MLNVKLPRWVSFEYPSRKMFTCRRIHPPPLPSQNSAGFIRKFVLLTISSETTIYSKNAVFCYSCCYVWHNLLVCLGNLLQEKTTRKPVSREGLLAQIQLTLFSWCCLRSVFQKTWHHIITSTKIVFETWRI